MKVPEQYQSHCCGAFIADFEQILYNGFHAYLTCFRHSCFHCFEQVNAIWEGYQKLKKTDGLMSFSNFQLGKVLV